MSSKVASDDSTEHAKLLAASLKIDSILSGFPDRSLVLEEYASSYRELRRIMRQASSANTDDDLIDWNLSVGAIEVILMLMGFMGMHASIRIGASTICAYILANDMSSATIPNSIAVRGSYLTGGLGQDEARYIKVMNSEAGIC